MKSYGIPYCGSKSAIAEWVVDVLPKAECLVDLFAGGGAVAHAALLSGKWDNVIINDACDGLTDAFRDLVNGERSDIYAWVSREGFSQTDDVLTRILWSYGNNACDYMYGREREKLQRDIHMMLTAPTLTERHDWYRRFISDMPVGNMTDRDSRSEAINRLIRAERLRELKGKRFETMCRDWRGVEIPEGAVVYCDIPYGISNERGHHRRYDGTRFDRAEFFNWAARTRNVFISEYDIRDDRFICVAERKRASHMQTTKREHMTERIYTAKE